MRYAFISAVVALLLLSGSGCAPAAQKSPVANVGPDRIPRITALYEQATARPVHRFRKPVRDRQARARQELQAECQRWLAELRTQAVPTALTGQAPAQPMASGAEVTALQFSLEQLSSSAGHGDPAAMRAAHAQALAAYRQAEADLRPAEAPQY